MHRGEPGVADVPAKVPSRLVFWRRGVRSPSWNLANSWDDGAPWLLSGLGDDALLF